MRTSTILGITLVGICSAWFAASSHRMNEIGRHFKRSNIHPVRDVFTPVSPTAVTLSGFLGKRCDANVSGWLLAKNEDSLLTCYTHRPGSYGWQGEHAGKWIHAATLACAYSGNPELRSKLDRIVKKLLMTQHNNGYLGTYRNGFHWGNGKDEKWDVWIHKYNLIGLLTYAHYTGNAKAFDAAKKIGNLLIEMFGPRSKLKLNTNGAHRGMVSGSVLEPIVLLYTMTNDIRYLQFGLSIAEQWEAPNGPKIISGLTSGSSVSETANGKAYEMLSCLIGLCELYRATGDNRFLTPVLNAWNDIKTNQLLPTGSGSQGEFWRTQEQVYGDTCDGLGEVCVTVSWLQFNQQLLRLTGEVRFADEIEKTLFNHLAAAQSLDGSAWSYFTNLSGRKTFTNKQTCCSSSGPRGWASVPLYAYLFADDGIVVNLFASGTARLVLPSGDSVMITQETDYPATGDLKFTVTVSKPTEFALYFRVPTWSHLVGNETVSGTYFRIRPRWSSTTPFVIRMNIPTRFDFGQSRGRNHAAIIRGPQVMALDEQFNSSLASITSVKLQSTIPTLRKSVATIDVDNQTVYSIDGIRYLGNGVEEKSAVILSPFSSSSINGTSYTVWIPIMGKLSSTTLARH